MLRFTAFLMFYHDLLNFCDLHITTLINIFYLFKHILLVHLLQLQYETKESPRRNVIRMCGSPS